jgi:class 3 adenylate cyclase
MRKEICEQDIIALEEFVSNNKFSEAEAYAEEILQSLPEKSFTDIQTSSVLHIRFGLAYTASLWRRGNGKKAELMARHTLALVEQVDEPILLGKALQTLGIVCERIGQYKESLEIQRLAVAQFRGLKLYDETAACLSNIGIVYKKLSDYTNALTVYDEALRIYEGLEHKIGIAKTKANIGNVLRQLGEYSEAIRYVSSALPLWEELGDMYGKAIALNNLAIIYEQIKEHHKAIDLYEQARAIDLQLGLQGGVGVTSLNIGNCWTSLKEYDKSIKEAQKAYAIFTELGNTDNQVIAMSSMANVYIFVGEYEQALTLYEEVLHLEQQMQRKDRIGLTYYHIGRTFGQEDFEGYNPDKAIELMEKASSICQEANAKRYELHARRDLAKILEKEGYLQEAIRELRLVLELEEYLYSEDTKSTIQVSMISLLEREKTELQEKNAQIIKQQETLEEQAQEIRLANTILLEQKAELETAHQQSEGLLLNILPQPIMERLKSGEKNIADHFQEASIFFADIQGFTALAEQLPAGELILGLNEIVSEFDRLARYHGLEKIKTMGDSYMAVSGLPEFAPDHAERATSFALAVAAFMEGYRFQGGGNMQPIQVRIGLHCGEVVAGVIGEDKFTYDVWGDTVNIASRMESHGEAGKIHVSEAFAHKIFGKFALHKRGLVDIKGKEPMKTYFIEHQV